MPVDGSLAALFRAHESELLERKRNANDLDAIRQTICALANDLGHRRTTGVVIIGQNDDLSCAGLASPAALAERLSALRGDGKLQPFPVISISAESVADCQLVVIRVEPTDNPPIRLDNRTFVRIGPTTRLASTEEERRLIEKRRAGALSFDAQGLSPARLDDIDLVRFRLEYLPSAVSREILEQNNRTVEEQLRALRLATAEGMPTAAAVLLLGKEPQAFLPGAYVQFLRVDGVKLTDRIVDEKVLRGSLIDQLRRLDELLETTLTTSLAIGGARHARQPSYPIAALRQLTRNALLHRSYDGTNAPVRVTWYSDRIEIQNPGGPYGSVTKTTFGQAGVADYRNPTLAEALKMLGFVERFGVGIMIAREELARNGNPPPQFLVEDSHVAVIVRSATA